MKRKFTFLLMALLTLAGFKSWGQETLTVCDGMDFNTQVPIYTGYFDVVGTTSQFIIPSTEIAGLQGGSITKLEFYIAGSPTFSSFDYAGLKCSLKEVDSEVINGIVTSGLSTVYEGLLTYTATTMSVTFTTPFIYTGGHLLVSFEVTSKSSYNECYFYGTNTSYVSSYCNQWVNTPISFIPKTTITYTGGSSCIAPTGLAASNITATGATISWTSNDAESYDLAYGVASTFDLSNHSTYTLRDDLNTTSVQLSGLTAETEYKCAVRSHCDAEDVSAWSSAVSFLPTAKMTLTVNESSFNNYNDRVPFQGYNADGLTKSQFIIPAASLTALEGADITALDFYTTTSGSNVGPADYTFNGSWDVYFKIVDYVIMPFSYESSDGMDKVYTGNMVISNSKMTLTFAEPYTYEGGNLMIYFNQTQRASYKYTYWRGVATSEYAARAGYTGSYGSDNANYYFLPTTTFTYLPSATYNVTVIPSEHGVITAEPKTDVTAGTTVSLSATPNTGYVFLGEWHVTNTTTSEEITVIDNQFTMPDSDVTVTATFEALVPHTVTIADNIQHGTVALAEDDPDGYYVGETIFLTVTPDEGYFYPNEDEITVTDDSGNPIDVTITEDHQYSFTMPNSDVTVTAEFNMYYMVNFDEEMLGGYIDATSDLVHFDQHPYFKAGTDVYFVPNSGEDYEYVEESILVYKGFDGGESVEVDFSSGLARITMPDTDIFVTASFNKVKFAVTQQNVNPMGSGSYSVSPTSHVAGNTSVYISNINPSDDYQFASVVVTRNDNQAAVETYAYYGDYVFYMPDSDVTVTVNFEEKPYYNVTVGTVTNGTVSVEDTTSFWAGVTVWLNVQPLSGDYILESITATPKEGDPITPTHNYSNYYTFTMPSSNVTISATFRLLQSYTINYYVNGELDRTMQCREDGLVNNDGPQNVAVPAGMTFEGWGVAEIGTYTTEKPAVLGNAESPTQNCDLYAVLSYSESVPATSKDGETWVEVTSPSDLSSGDQVIFVEKINSKVLTERTGEYDGCFRSANISISNNEISSIPSNAVVFEAESTSGSWKFWFEDAFRTGLTTLTDCNGGYLVPVNMNWGGSDLWTIISNGSSVNIIGASNQPIVYKSGDFTTESSSVYKRSALFKKYNPVITTNYYMTSVLADGEVTENTTAKNIVITTGTVTVDNDIVLTMAENGLFRNENAANFVFEDGAQLITDNTGVLATMKKNINCNASKESDVNWYTISSPLAANTEFANVTNLIPNNVTDTDYDLYYLDEENGFWVNARPEAEQTSDFTTIDKGRGYIYSKTTAADIAFAGEINVADVECNLTNGALNGFNLIGNPFSQNITLDNVVPDETAELAEGFYVLTNQNTWGTKLTDSEIKPLQGFLVQATTAGDVTISKPTSSSKEERSNEQNTSIEVIVSNNNYSDNTYAMFGEGTGLNKVSHRNAQAPMIYIPQGNEDFAIAFMNENTTVFPVSFKAMTTGKYSISLKATDDISTLVLVDNMTGTETNMLLEDSYSFIGSPADNGNRFTVKLGISHSNGQSDSEHFVYQSGNELVINGEGTLQIFDVLGRVVISEEVHGQTVNVGNLSTGAYIVRLTGESVMTQKIVVR